MRHHAARRLIWTSVNAHRCYQKVAKKGEGSTRRRAVRLIKTSLRLSQSRRLPTATDKCSNRSRHGQVGLTRCPRAATASRCHCLPERDARLIAIDGTVTEGNPLPNRSAPVYFKHRVTELALHSPALLSPPPSSSCYCRRRCSD